jgi:hypothetical protein
MKSKLGEILDKSNYFRRSPNGPAIFARKHQPDLLSCGDE